MSPADAELVATVVERLRELGAHFAFVFGSHARDETGEWSDLDVAAWWPFDPPQSFDVLLPSNVDLMVLNNAPLELAGRVAVEGMLLFDDDATARVHWVANTRKIYFDELPRLTRSHQEFAEAVQRGR